MSLFTKRERSLIFSGLKKSTFLKSMLLSNFLIWWSWNILNKNSISMMLNKCLIQWFWVDVTTKPWQILFCINQTPGLRSAKLDSLSKTNDFFSGSHQRDSSHSGQFSSLLIQWTLFVTRHCTNATHGTDDSALFKLVNKPNRDNRF